jgi:xanthine dehydrogenase YagS FAD-binding subunit
MSQAIARLQEGSPVLAGGTDLVGLLKAGLRNPDTLVDVKNTDLPSGIELTDDGMSIGALTTISDIEQNTLLREDYTLLTEAAEQTATPQLRNRATVGGNLLQEPRCWYYRMSDVQCWLKGGSECPAREGRNETHALISASPCVAVHPSDLAGCLLALDATVVLNSVQGERRLPLQEFFSFPREGRRRATGIAADELLLSVEIPKLDPTCRSTYLKAMARRTWTFALVGVAAVISQRDGAIETASVVVNGVAPVPWLLASNATRDAPMTAKAVKAELIESFDSDAEALSHNHYKIALTHALIEQAIDSMLEPSAN